MPEEEKKLDPKQQQGDQPTPKDDQKGSGRKGKGRKRGGKYNPHRQNPGKQDPKGVPGSKHNDVSWYLANPNLATAVGSFSMNDPLGTVYHDSTRVMFTKGTQKLFISNPDGTKDAVPGIAAVKFMPTLPLGPKTGANFINQLAMKLYIFVRHQNSGHANYEYADLMQALYSIISVNGIYGTLTRLYGTMLKYSVLNKYKARALVHAQGFDYDDIAKHIPDLYAVIERMRTAFDSYPIPKKLPVADRQLWMTSNVFKDTEDEKTPLWLFVQSHWYSVPNIDGVQTAMATPWANGDGDADDGTCQFQNIADFVDDLIARLCSEEDYGIIFGDILKAYGKENCAVLLQIPRDYTVTEVYDANANLQLHNASVFDYNMVGFSAFNAYISQNQETHSLEFVCRLDWDDTSVTHYTALSGNDFTLSFPKKDITPGDMLVATRLRTIWFAGIPSGKSYLSLRQCGTEIVTGINLYTFYTTDGSDSIELRVSNFFGAYVFNVKDTPANTMLEFVSYTRFLSYYYQFSHLPRVYLTAYVDAGDSGLILPTSLYGLFDMACFLTIDASNLDSLNYTAAMSEFGYTDAIQVG